MPTKGQAPGGIIRKSAGQQELVVESYPEATFRHIKKMTNDELDSFLATTRQDLSDNQSPRHQTGADEMGFFFSRTLDSLSRSLGEGDLETLYKNLLSIYQSAKTNHLKYSKALRIFRVSPSHFLRTLLTSVFLVGSFERDFRGSV